MKKEIKVEWTGSYPCLCSGRWAITIDGNDVSDCIPVDLQSSPMNTKNDYQQWILKIGQLYGKQYIRDYHLTHGWLRINGSNHFQLIHHSVKNCMTQLAIVIGFMALVVGVFNEKEGKLSFFFVIETK